MAFWNMKPMDRPRLQYRDVLKCGLKDFAMEPETWTTVSARRMSRIKKLNAGHQPDAHRTVYRFRLRGLSKPYTFFNDRSTHALMHAARTHGDSTEGKSYMNRNGFFSDHPSFHFLITNLYFCYFLCHGPLTISSA